MTKEQEKAFKEAIKAIETTTESNIDSNTVLSAGICDNCSIPKMMNTGNGRDEPPDPILYCQKMKREINPEPPEDRMVECQYYTYL